MGKKSWAKAARRKKRYNFTPAPFKQQEMGKLILLLVGYITEYCPHGEEFIKSILPELTICIG